MKDGAQVESAVEEVLHLAEITRRVFLKVEGVVRTGQRSLDVAQGGVDGEEGRMLGAGRTTAGDVGLMEDGGTPHGSEASQAVGDQGGRRRQRLLGKGLNRLLGEGPLRKAHLISKMIQPCEGRLTP